MMKLIIRGRVLPIAVKMNIAFLPSLSWAETSDVTPNVFTATIADSTITIECSTNHYNPNDSSLLIIRAYQYARAVVDCIAFTFGEGLSVVLDELTDSSGIKSIRFANGNLAALPKTFSAQEFPQMYRLIVGEPQLFLSLSDLVTAITTPGNVATGCARAVEGLRTILLSAEEDRSWSWDVFRHVLNLEKSYIDYIMKASIGGRHGSKFDSGQDNGLILERSWIIMDRFIAFRKQGNMPLSTAVYPLLS